MLLTAKSNPKLRFKPYQVIKIISNFKRNQIDDITIQKSDMIRHLLTTIETIAKGSKGFHNG